MRKHFPEEAYHSADSFVQEVFNRNDAWTWCLYGMAKKHQRHLIDDALQNFYCAVFLKWEKIPKESPAKMMGFLYIMLRNEFINTLRRERRLTYLDDLHPAEHPAGMLYHLCFDALAEEHSVYLAGLLAEFDFQILTMKMQGYRSKEIAQSLDVKTNYIEVRLHRVRKLLRPHFSVAENS